MYCAAVRKVKRHLSSSTFAAYLHHFATKQSFIPVERCDACLSVTLKSQRPAHYQIPHWIVQAFVHCVVKMDVFVEPPSNILSLWVGASR